MLMFFSESLEEQRFKSEAVVVLGTPRHAEYSHCGTLTDQHTVRQLAKQGGRLMGLAITIDTFTWVDLLAIRMEVHNSEHEKI